MNHEQHRFNESGSIPFRSGRFYTVDSEWWFAIRRGPDKGPYSTKDAAKLALIEYLNDQFAFEKRLQQNEVAIISGSVKSA